MSTIVDLRPREVRDAATLAEDRFGTVKDEDGDWVDGYTNDGLRDHYIGTLSEMAFAKYYCVQMDAEIYRRKDCGVDFRVRIDNEDFDNEIIDVDVKGSAVEDPELQIEEGTVTADYYVLCRFPEGLPEKENHGTVEIVGGATDKMILRQDLRPSLQSDHNNYHFQAKYLRDLPGPGEVQPVE